MNKPTRVQFWGTRGSIPRPGRDTLRYGGNTSCVQVTSPKGALVILDCGSGVHDLGRDLVAKATGPLRGHILISHTHWDHIQGFPFFAPLFVRGGHWDIYGPSGLGQSLRETLAGQMQYSYFPVTLDELGASIRFHDLAEGSFEIDDIRIKTHYLNHPALTLGYRLETDNACVVYACDHEPFSRNPGHPAPLHENDRLHSDFLAGADLVIHDSQFTDAEYVAKKGWGHSTVEYVTEMGIRAGVRQMALTHHDPGRTDDDIDKIVEFARANLSKTDSTMQLFGAADGQVIELQRSTSDLAGGGVRSFKPAAAPAIKDSLVIIGVADAELAAALSEASAAQGVRAVHVAEGAGVLRLARSTPPALVLLEDQLPDLDGLEVCKSLRMDGDHSLLDVPIVIVGGQERAGEADVAGATAWLASPFSVQYAKAQIQAWLMRSACRWLRAEVPVDEDLRLAGLRELSILDTPAEERFDRITRIAAALADAPIALVSLVDEDRQWFKSCLGLGANETPRELAFCAHVVVSRKPMIVPDTHLDDRFADSPLVTGGPRIRFYAGFPLFHSNGGCLGTLCLIDTRPRQFPETTLRMLADLAGVVQQEINATSDPSMTPN